MAPKGRRKVILTKMDYDALCKNMQFVESSQLYYTATAQLDVKGRKLTDAEKGRKSELEESERRPFKKESRQRR